MDDIKIWDLYHQKTFSEDYTPSKYAEEREKFFPRGCIIVDVGGGIGSDAIYFLRKGHKVILLDISGFALKKAKERAYKEKLDKNLIVRQLDFGLHNIPIKDNTVDVVYSRISLNYFGSKHTAKLFSDIYKMLRKGGKAYLTFRSSEDKEDMDYLKNVASVYEPNVFIVNGQLLSRFSQEQLKDILIKAGIPNFSVNPYVEEIIAKSENLRESLLVNEVVFEKI